MKFLFFIVILSVISVSIRSESYTTKYDNLDIDQVLENKRLVAAYVKCVTDQGRCTPEGRELKSHIKEALVSGCEKCTTKQKGNIRKVIKHMVKYEREAWKQLVQKYDPENVYSDKYEKELGEIES